MLWAGLNSSGIQARLSLQSMEIWTIIWSNIWMTGVQQSQTSIHTWVHTHTHTHTHTHNFIDFLNSWFRNIINFCFLDSCKQSFYKKQQFGFPCLCPCFCLSGHRDLVCVFLCQVTRGPSADRETEVVRVTAQGPRCVRVAQAALRLCVVWVCGLQLTALWVCVCVCSCVCVCVCSCVCVYFIQCQVQALCRHGLTRKLCLPPLSSPGLKDKHIATTLTWLIWGYILSMYTLTGSLARV